MDEALMLRPNRDLRSDALTLPTRAMWTAMRKCEPDWATFGEDRTVRYLEAMASDLVGKEAGLFVATGGMANLVGLLAQTRPGDTLIAEQTAHVVRSEGGGFDLIGGVELSSLPGDRGHFDAQAAADALAGRSQLNNESLVWLENTHVAAGGTVQSVIGLESVCNSAHAAGARVHLDGARMFNAAAALGVRVAELVREVDSVMFNLNKGLSAPIGALLAGDEAFITSAREWLHRIGGGSLHQAGIWASAGVLALQTMVDRLPDDHLTARRLAELLGNVDGVQLAAPVQTNIVLVKPPPHLRTSDLVHELRLRGVGAYAPSADVIRFVTHRHVALCDLDLVAAELAEVVRAGV